MGLSTGLLFLIGPAMDAAGYSGVKLVLAMLALALFVAAYLTAGLIRQTWTEPLDRRGQAVYGLFVALAVVLPFVFGSEWVGMPVYLGVLSAVVLSARWAPVGVIGATAVSGVQTWLLGLPGGGILSITGTVFGVGMMMLGFRHARTLVQQLQEARGEVARLAANEERLRIARDLHDLLGHSLSLIVLKSELAGRVAARDPARTTQEVRDIESVARQALADVREVVSGYRQRTLTGELDSARAVLAAAGVDVVVRLPGSGTTRALLPEGIDALFGWAVREGVTNVVRHARAARCEIVVSRDGRTANLRIDDDGTGSPGTADAHGTAGPDVTGAGAGGPGRGGVGGNGLVGLRERIEAAGGSIEAGPRSGGGFRLTVRVPVSVPGPEAVAAGEPTR
jgi:two-component system sensor histidine kinase DesK